MKIKNECNNKFNNLKSYKNRGCTISLIKLKKGKTIKKIYSIKQFL